MVTKHVYIDCDSHITPADAMDYLGDEMAHLKPVLTYDSEGRHASTHFPAGWPSGGWTEVPGFTPGMDLAGSGGKHDGLYSVDFRVYELDKMGIDLQMLVSQFSPWAWSYLVEPKLAAAMARSFNTSLLRIIERHPDRFFGAALVPLQDVPAAIRELEWAHANGFRVAVSDEIFPSREHPFGDPLGTREELWPFFAKCEELGMPVFLHRIQHGHRIVNVPTFQKFGLDIFAPNDTHVTLASLVTSGLLDDFPNLKIVKPESGTGWLKPFLEQLDSIYAGDSSVDYTNTQVRSRRVVPPGSRPLVPPELASERNKKLPSYYFKRNFWFAIETEEEELPEAVRFLGAERFLFATDYPHDDPGGRMKYEDVRLFEANTEIPEPEKELIRSGNAKQLFRLD